MHARATIGLGFTSDWLKEWRENFEPITEWNNAQPKQFANYFRHSIENRSSIRSTEERQFQDKLIMCNILICINIQA